MKPIISPSILSADFGHLARDIEMINRSEAEWVHIDISWTVRNMHFYNLCNQKSWRLWELV